MDLAAEGIGFWDWELTEGRLNISSEWLAMMGYQESDLPEVPKLDNANLGEMVRIWSQYIHPEDREEAEQAIANYLVFRKTPTYNNQFRFRRKDNEYIQIYSNGYAEWDVKGNLLRFRVNHVDVTELGGFDRTMLAQFRYMEDSAKQQASMLETQLTRMRRILIAVSTLFVIALMWVSGTFQAIQTAFKLTWANRQNPISAIAKDSDQDIANFTAFYDRKDEISLALARHITFNADRAVFGYYEPGPSPQRGRIAAQAQRQSVRISISERPWAIDNETLIDRRDAHLNGEVFLINSPFAGLYDAGFQISAPGFWVRGDGPAIAWFVGIECEPRRLCNEDNIDIKALKAEVDDILSRRRE